MEKSQTVTYSYKLGKLTLSFTLTTAEEKAAYIGLLNAAVEDLKAEAPEVLSKDPAVPAA